MRSWSCFLDKLTSIQNASKTHTEPECYLTMTAKHNISLYEQQACIIIGYIIIACYPAATVVSAIKSISFAIKFRLS